MFGKQLILPEEVMEEPVWKIARLASETGAATMGQACLPTKHVSYGVGLNCSILWGLIVNYRKFSNRQD